MNKRLKIEDKLQPSPLLGYKLEPPAQEYRIGPIIMNGEETLTKERLIIDIVNHILRRDIVSLKDVVDSLMFFAQLIYDKSRYYEVDLEVPTEDIFKIMSNYPQEYFDRANFGIFNRLTLYRFSRNSLDTEANSDDRLYILSKNRVRDYPDIQSVIHRVKDIDYKVAGTVLAGLYILVDQTDNALKVYEKMQHIGSMNDYDHYNLGTIYLQRNDTERARKHLQEVGEIEEACYQIGVAYMYDNDWDQAIEYFSKLANDYHSDYQSQYLETVTLSQFISQFSWNNIGICRYRNMNNGSVKTRLVKALDMFQKAALWEQATFRPDGKYNVDQSTKLLMDIAGEHTKPSPISIHNGYSNIIGNSDAMQKVYAEIEKAARSDSTVLITGETGTGKELVARAIHDNSSRKDKPYISLNSSAIPNDLIESDLFGHEKGAFTSANSRVEGKFELADNGTLFLDEIGEMSHAVQAKILRAIKYKEFMRVGGKEDIKVNTRIIAATNRDLEKAIEDGIFREDLYYRLSVLNIHLPLLRDRKDDIPLLIEHFLSDTRISNDRRLALSDTAMEMLMEYNWPGNIRQLRSAIESSANRADGEIIHSWDLPEKISRELPANDSIEKMRIIEAYRALNGNATKTISKLGMPKSTFYHKVGQYDINLDAIKAELKNRS